MYIPYFPVGQFHPYYVYSIFSKKKKPLVYFNYFFTWPMFPRHINMNEYQIWEICRERERCKEWCGAKPIARRAASHKLPSNHLRLPPSPRYPSPYLPLSLSPSPLDSSQFPTQPSNFLQKSRFLGARLPPSNPCWNRLGFRPFPSLRSPPLPSPPRLGASLLTFLPPWFSFLAFSSGG